MKMWQMYGIIAHAYLIGLGLARDMSLWVFGFGAIIAFALVVVGGPEW